MSHKDIHNGNLLHHYFNNKQIDGLYLSTAIKAFAASFISIFVPIYLLSLGFDLKDVALYYLLSFSLVNFTFPIGMKLNSKIGVKKVMSLGIVISIIYYLLLNNLSSGGISYIWVAIVAGISGGIYWSGFHIEFSRFCDKGKEASETSLLHIFSKIAGAIGPILGAILILRTSFNFLFLLSTILLGISIIPLFFTKNEKTTFTFSVKKILRVDKRNKSIAYVAAGIIGAATQIFWPVFIYLTLKEVLSLGIIISIVAITEIIFMFFVGKLSDTSQNKILKRGIFAHSISWMTRILFLSPLGLFLNNLYASLSASLVNLPFAKIVYAKSKRSQDVSNYFLFRDFYLWVGRVTILCVVLLTSSIFWVFIISFFVTFLYFYLLKKD